MLQQMCEKLWTLPVATVPALQGCHTQAKSLDTLMKRVREVIELCIEDSNGDVPELELVAI